MQQMELREALEDAQGSRDAGALDKIRSDLRASRAALEKQLDETIDSRKDYAAGASLVRKLMFLEKLDSEIDRVYEAIE
jgi:molecular chaperone HscB